MTAPPVLLEHPASLSHDTGRHPERAERMIAIDEQLARLDWLGYERVLSPRIARSMLTISDATASV